MGSWLKKIAIIIGFSFLFAGVAIAANTLPSPEIKNLPFSGVSSEKSIALIIKEVVKYTAILAIISLTWGGIQFILSAWEDQRVKTAKNIILYSLLGVILSVSAYAMVDVITALTIN